MDTSPKDWGQPLFIALSQSRREITHIALNFDYPILVDPEPRSRRYTGRSRSTHLTARIDDFELRDFDIAAATRADK
jgi:hypothetical protein